MRDYRGLVYEDRRAEETGWIELLAQLFLCTLVCAGFWLFFWWFFRIPDAIGDWKTWVVAGLALDVIKLHFWFRRVR